MTIEHNEAFVVEGTEKLLEQFKGKPRIEALLAAFLGPVQTLEDDVWAVIVSRMIDDAVGEQLKTLGRLVGEPYKGQDEEVYRLFVKARIAINHSDGHPDDIIRVLRIVEATTFRYHEVHPATIWIDYIGTPVAPPDVLFQLANSARDGGVKLYLTFGNADYFSNCAGTADVVDAAHGYAPEDLSSGGYMSGLVTQ